MGGNRSLAIKERFSPMSFLYLKQKFCKIVKNVLYYILWFSKSRMNNPSEVLYGAEV